MQNLAIADLLTLSTIYDFGFCNPLSFKTTNSTFEALFINLLHRSCFGKSNSFESSWVTPYKVLTPWIGQFIPFFLWSTGWEVSHAFWSRFFSNSNTSLNSDESVSWVCLSRQTREYFSSKSIKCHFGKWTVICLLPLSSHSEPLYQSILIPKNWLKGPLR